MIDLIGILWRILAVSLVVLICLVVLYVVVVLAIAAYKQIREMLDE